MRKYSIINLKAEGYERTAKVRTDPDLVLTVDFLENGEYLEGHEKSTVRKEGSVIEAPLVLDYIIDSALSEEQIGYRYISDAHIEAVVDVLEIIDEESMWVQSAIVPEKIRAEFIDAPHYKKGDRIYVNGRLTLDLLWDEE